MKDQGFRAVRLHEKRIVSTDAYNDMCSVIDSLLMAIKIDELTRTERKAIERAYERLYQFRHYRDKASRALWPSE